MVTSFRLTGSTSVPSECGGINPGPALCWARAGCAIRNLFPPGYSARAEMPGNRARAHGAPMANCQHRRRRQGQAARAFATGQTAATTPAMPVPLASMTGFARTEGMAAGLSWVWELRSVNGRGLDLRLRLPPGWDALEPGLRDGVSKVLKRGNVTANLTVKRDTESRLSVDPAALEQALTLAMDLHRRIPGSPVPRAET